MRCAVFVALFLAGSLAAQTAEVRYELGKRVHAFEVAWEAKATDADTKKRVAPVVNQAVQNFFRFNFAAVGKTIDQARHLLTSKDAVPPAVQYAESLYIVPETRAVHATTTDLNVTVKPFYKVDGETPKVTLRLQFGDGPKAEHVLGELPATFAVRTSATGNPNLDTTLTATYLDATGKVLATQTLGISRIERFEERLKAISAAVEKQPKPPTTIEQATLAQHVKLLTSVAQKNAHETDYPCARLLAEAELLAQGGEHFNAKKSGESWLSVPTGKTTTSARILVPAKLDAKPVPVVVALHGMGGSENMFFDAYGNGIIPKLAAQRGWLVVATRVEGLLGAGPAPNIAALLDELQKRYPIDAKQVYLIGHSLGAGHVLQLTQQQPTRYAAAVALGGGGRIAKADSVKAVPFFVGCGKLDFALGGAKNLAQSLDGGKVTFKEYEDIEHLVIVAAAAHDVFKFLDGLKR